MYKGASQNQQRRVDFISPADLAQSGPEVLPPEAQWENLKLAVQSLEAQIKCEPDEDRRKELGLQKFAFQNQIKELKLLVHTRKIDMGHFLIHELKGLIPKALYEIALKNSRKAFEDWEAAGRPPIEF